MAFVQDTFTDTAGTALASHTGEIGATWTEHPIHASGDMAISDANRARGSANANCCFYASGLPAGADYDIEAVLRPIDIRGDCGVIARANTVAATYYWARYVQSTARWELLRVVTAALTSLGFFAATLTAGTDYTLKLTVRGTGAQVDLEVFVDGVSRITYADTDAARLTTAGRVGIRMNPGTATPTNANQIHVDSFTATDVAGGGGASLAGRNLTMMGVG